MRHCPAPLACEDHARRRRFYPQIDASARLTAHPEPILSKRMTLVRILSLSLVAIGVPIFGFSMDIKETDQGALCGGRPYARISVPDGASPYVELTADGVTGPFLLDYGATRSSLSASSFSGPDGSIRTAAISLPGIEKSGFSPRPLLPPASAGKWTARGHRRRSPVPVYRPTDGQHSVPERRDLSTRGAHRAWLDPRRPKRLFLFRPFQSSAPASPMCRSSFCAWETFASGRKSTRATRISSIPARSTSTRPCSTV